VIDYISIPFYDLFHANGHVPEVRGQLPPLLVAGQRSILEIGAGTGLITTVLADLSTAEIYALEPSAAMRGVLLSRLSARPELLSRVTVLPCDALSVKLEDPADVIVMINVLYGLEPDYRRLLWPTLATSLEGAGLLIFTWREGGPPLRGPLREIGARQVGRHTYTVLSEVLDSDGEACRARYVYRVSDGASVLSEEEITSYSYRPSREILRNELESAGFVLAKEAEGLLAWRLA